MDVHQSLYQRILHESVGREPAHPMLRFYVENGVRSMGCAFRFASLKREYPGDYERLTLEKRGQDKLL